jgi:uncharacterized glyoxalase superfamily protein PhnB
MMFRPHHSETTRSESKQAYDDAVKSLHTIQARSKEALTMSAEIRDFQKTDAFFDRLRCVGYTPTLPLRKGLP